MKSRIHFLEKGNYNPSLQLAHAIAKTFGQGIEDVFILDGPQGPSERYHGSAETVQTNPE